MGEPPVFSPEGVSGLLPGRFVMTCRLQGRRFKWSDKMNQRRMNRGMRRAWMIVGTLLVLSLIVLILLTVFRIQKFTVVGNERVSADRIEYDLCYDFKTGNKF